MINYYKGENSWDDAVFALTTVVNVFNIRDVLRGGKFEEILKVEINAVSSDLKQWKMV